jgi:bacterioferritin-associated ferredoxin
MYICVCKGIKEADVKALGQAGVTCPKMLASTMEIDDEDNCCGRCINNISDFVTIASEEHVKCSSSVKA